MGFVQHVVCGQLVNFQQIHLGFQFWQSGVQLLHPFFGGCVKVAEPIAGNLIRTLHRDFCGDLVPEWAGQWRTIAVQVGSHEPPAPHLVSLQMREYSLDLQARLADPIQFESLPDI
jgi:hypothetical protein